jgi:hypothetical protein
MASTCGAPLRVPKSLVQNRSSLPSCMRASHAAPMPGDIRRPSLNQVPPGPNTGSVMAIRDHPVPSFTMK